MGRREMGQNLQKGSFGQKWEKVPTLVVANGYSTYRRHGNFRFKPEHNCIAMSVLLFVNAVFYLSNLKKILSFVLFRNKISQILKIFQVRKTASVNILPHTTPESSFFAFVLEDSRFSSCCLLPFTPAMLWMEPVSPGWLSWPYSSLRFPRVEGKLFSCFYRAALIPLSSAVVFQKGTEQKSNLPYFSSSYQQCSFMWTEM